MFLGFAGKAVILIGPAGLEIPPFSRRQGARTMNKKKDGAMVRTKLAAAIVGAGMCLPGLVSALGIGDYSLRSYLSQPLELEIELVQPQDLTLEEIFAGLASQEEFDRAGIDRGYLLTDMRFEVVQRNGRMYVIARTRQSIDEPFLNFLLDVRWPQGRMLREYTILLDPPVYKPGAAPTATVEPVVSRQEPVAGPAVKPAAPPPAVAGELPPPPTAATKTPPAAARPSTSPAAEPTPVSAEGYRVQAGDTMWGIAARHRAASASVQQTMIAIQRANPEAFISGNVNLVRKGMILRIPQEAEVAQIADRDAGNAVSEQTRTWRELLDNRATSVQPADGPALDSARKADAAPAAGKKPTGAGEVTLVAPKATGKTDTAQAGKEADALRNRLMTTEEELSKASRQNKELSSRLSDLDKQVKASDKLLSLKNTEIAELQAELNRLRKEKGLPPLAAAPGEKQAKADQKVAAVKQEAAKQAPAAKKDAEKPAVSKEVPSEAVVTEAAEPAAPASDAPAPAVAEKKKEKEKEKEKPAKEKARDKEKKAIPAQPPAKAPEGSSFLLPIAGLLAALGIGGGAFWYMRRRRQASAETTGAYEPAESHDEQIADDLAQLRDLNLGGDESAAPESVAAPAGETESSDPLGEADMYMAYGRFQQAADILYGALQREPNRDDIRVKLAEAYAELGDQASAREQASQLTSAADAGIRSQASALLSRLGGAASVAVQASPVSAAAEPSLDDLALEFAGESETRAPAPETPVFEPMDEFSLDLPEEAPVLAGKGAQAARPAESLDSGSLEFSLDDADMGDFGLQEEPAAAAPVAPVPAASSASSVDEMDLAFELDQAEPVEDVALAEPATELASDEFDLGFDDVQALEEPAVPAVEEVAFEEAPPVAPAPVLDLQSELADLDADLSSQGVGGEAAAGGDDFDFLADSDENATKLDLAKAYIEMGDAEGARDILNEVIADGSASQKTEAKSLLAQVG